MNFLLTHTAQGKLIDPPVALNAQPEPRSKYHLNCQCRFVFRVAPESVAALVSRRLVLEYQSAEASFVCGCLGVLCADPSPQAPFSDLARKFKSAWRPSEHIGFSQDGFQLDGPFERALDELLVSHVEHMAELMPKPKIGTMKLERSLICLDTETTGTNSETDRVIELGIVRLDPDGKRHSWQQRFNPGFPIPAEATIVHHITDADVANSPTFESMAEKIHRGLQGRDIAGYSLRLLDLPILDTEFRRVGLKLDLTGIRVIDAAGIFFNKKPRTLSAAVEEYCGRSHEDAHGAAADAAASLDVLFGQLGRYDDLSVMTLDDLAAFSRRGEFESADLAGKTHWDAEGKLCYSFGKNRDQRIEDEPGFGQWLLRQRSPAFPASTCEVVAAELKRIGLL